MPDQASQLRQLVREAVAQHGELAPGAPVVAVSGGSRGVGATTIACSVARELSRLGKQVVLLDANLVRPAVAKLLGVRPSATIADVLSGRRRAAEAAASVEGLRVIAGVAAGQSAPLDAESLVRFAGELSALGRQCDVVVLDAGAGMSPWTDRLWQAARHVLLATTPDDAAVLDAYAAVKLSRHQAIEGKLRLIVNRASSAVAAAHAAARFEDTCRRFLGVTAQETAALPSLAPSSGHNALAGVDGPFARAARALAADLVVCGSVSGRLPHRGNQAREASCSDSVARTQDSSTFSSTFSRSHADNSR